MSGAILRGEATGLWRDLVLDGEARSATTLEEDVEAYLVFVLMRHLGDSSLLRRTMALELLDALESSGRTRLDELRDVGDRCLLISGMFPRLATRRRVGAQYFADLGRGAYAHVADATQMASAELFARLAAGFDAMVAVLAHAAAQVQYRSDGQPTLTSACAPALLCVGDPGRRVH